MKKIIGLIQLLICTININGQDVNHKIISTTGETFQGNSIQIDWTLGEVLITPIEVGNAQITQGFHQPDYTITNLEELPMEIGEIKIYPNPTAKWIEVDLQFLKERNVQILLFDFLGKLLWTKNKYGLHISERKEINKLPNGSYLFIFLIDGERYSQSFIIQKNQ